MARAHIFGHAHPSNLDTIPGSDITGCKLYPSGGPLVVRSKTFNSFIILFIMEVTRSNHRILIYKVKHMVYHIWKSELLYEY